MTIKAQRGKMTQDEYEKTMKEFYDQMRNNPSKIVHYGTFGGTFPTGIDSIGRYHYQEPEVDEQGTYYGYKVLHVNPYHPEQFISPRYQKFWSGDGELEADHEPHREHRHGIHCTKKPDHPKLINYIGRYNNFADSIQHLKAYRLQPWYLVRCALSGTVIETEQGFRAQHAQIIGVLFDGHWKSYQDYKERAQAYSHSTPEEPWYDPKERRRYTSWTRGYWNTDPYNPNP